MRVIFMGTPDFGVPVLEAIVRAGHEVAAAVTQPDRPKGRGKGVAMSPVKEAAMRLGIPVLQPVKVKAPEAVAELKNLAPDVIVVVAFGQILSQEILDIPPFGCVNVHASLLPKYRGAAPIQQAILDGEEETGITTMLMDKGLDTGCILLQERVAIAPDETGGSLFDKLSAVGAPLLVKTLDGLAKGEIKPIPQEGETCYAGMLDKSMGRIDWTESAAAIDRKVRALNPWPSAYTALAGSTVKIWKAEVLPAGKSPENGAAVTDNLPSAAVTPGTVTASSESGIDVATGDGILRILELQAEGKKRMESAAYLRGHAVPAGTLLG